MGAYSGKIFEYKCNGIFAVEFYFLPTASLWDLHFLRKLILIRLQFLPAVGNTTWPWVYMEHKLGGDK